MTLKEEFATRNFSKYSLGHGLKVGANAQVQVFMVNGEHISLMPCSDALHGRACLNITPVYYNRSLFA